MLKKGLKIYGILLIVNIMAFFINISVNALTLGIFTENIGYTAYGYIEETGEKTEAYTYYYRDGEDTKKQELIDNGYEVNTASLRSPLKKSVDIISKLLSGGICLSMVALFIFNEMLRYGYKERTAVKYKGQKEKLYKGFLIGIIPVIPAILFLIILTFLKYSVAKSFPLLFYGILNTYIFDFLLLLANGATTFGSLAIWKILIIFLLILFVPLSTGISYIIGYKDLSIGEKIIYKNKK